MSIGFKKAALGIGASLVLFALVVPLAFWLVIVALDRALGLGSVLSKPISQIAAATFLFLGVFWASWAYSFLVFVGRGLPLELFGYALHPTRVLVTTGPYAYTRHPMVLGMLSILLGIAAYQRSISGLVLVPVIGALVGLYLVRYEEKALVARFGDDYTRYAGNVPLLFPRLSSYVHEPAAN